MLADIKKAKQLLQELDPEDQENLQECINASKELLNLTGVASDLTEALDARIEYLKAAGQEEDETPEGV